MNINEILVWVLNSRNNPALKDDREFRQSFLQNFNALPGKEEDPRLKVYQYITDEFDNQDEKWGALRDQSGYIWLAGIAEECGEAAETLLKDQHWYLTKAELIQVAALVVNWIVSMEYWIDQKKVNNG